MTNLEAKQEAIKKAYGEYYDELHLNINHETGWCYVFKGNIHNVIDSKTRMCPEHDSWIPKSLLNLDYNNGWIRIEPDGSNLPTDGNKYDVFVNGKKFRNPAFVDQNKWLYEADGNLWVVENVTHYKPITPELLPIY